MIPYLQSAKKYFLADIDQTLRDNDIGQWNGSCWFRNILDTSYVLP